MSKTEIDNVFDLNANIEAKNKFAKLLATENISVEHQETNVPAFNIKTRELILPIWSDYTEPLLDRIIGHEVAHAVYTPQKEFLELAEKIANKKLTTKSSKEEIQEYVEHMTLMQFINVVEDIRIEKHIITKYPGLLSQFIKSGKDLMDRDYFGLKKNNKKIEDLNLADKVNLFFKIDVYDKSLNLDFDPKYNDIMGRLARVEIWPETVSLAKELMELCKKENPSLMTDVILVEGEGEGEGTDGSGTGKDDDKGKNIIGVKVIETQASWNKNKNNSKSVKSEDKNNTSNNKNNSPINYISVGNSEYDPNSYVVPFHEMKNSFVVANSYMPRVSEWREFTSSVNIFLSSMIMEFQRKKKAAIWLSRERNITGHLDMNALYKHTLSDEIFRSEIKVRKGKNHSIVLFVDFSSSMDSTLEYVMKQLYLMVLFCRKLGIKHEVYAFNDNDYHPNSKGKNIGRLLGRSSVSLSHRFKLVELYTYRMNEAEFVKQAEDLYSITYSNKHSYSGYSHNKFLITNGTPLNDTLILSYDLMHKIKAEHKTDILNSIVLTDGDSNNTGFFNKWAGGSVSAIYHNMVGKYFFNSTYSGKTYTIGNSNYDVTLALVNILKSDLGIKMINFNILGGGHSNIDRYLSPNADKVKYKKDLASNKKVGIFGRDCLGWDAVILSYDSMLDIKSSNVDKTKQILQLVTDLIS